jgi:type IV pilus assembly protein PilW
MRIPFGGRDKSSAGFSLVEIMVGMAIGLLGIIIMLQMLSFSENQKRTTSGSNDAQNGGAIALYGLQRDIQLSGYGISGQNSGNTPNLLGCSLQLRAGVTLNALAPVTINYATIPAAASDPNTDTVMVVYGNSNGSEEGDSISAQVSQTNYTAGTAGTPIFYNPNDYVIAQYAARQAICSLFMDRVTAAYPPLTNPVIVTTGIANITTTNTSGSASPMLYDLGQSPTIRVYAVYHGNLTVCDYTASDCGSAANVGNTAIWVPTAGNIVSMRAQYGRDTTAGTMDGMVNIWDQTTPTTACTWARVPSVRIALVAIGSYSSATVLTVAPNWDGTTAAAAAAPLPANVATPINLTQIPILGTTSWQNYHYKVFQTAVPIRNISMQGVIAGC